MASFIITLIVIVVCGLIFGKADTKKKLLNQVGLDLSDSNYQNRKEAEFAKYCKKAMRIAAEHYRGSTEDDFLAYIGGFLESKYWDNQYIGVEKHYVYFAFNVVYRRQEAINKGKKNNIPNIYDFSNKNSINKYINKLWEENQYPWPENWLQSDGV